jgi:hypothetical protein
MLRDNESFRGSEAREDPATKAPVNKDICGIQGEAIARGICSLDGEATRCNWEGKGRIFDVVRYPHGCVLEPSLACIGDRSDG